MSKPTKINTDQIVLDHSTQARVAMDEDKAREYAEEMAEGATFPPVDLYQDGEAYYIGDGWHRVAGTRINQAKELKGYSTVNAIVRPGGRLAAIEAAIRANHAHGLKRTNRDKRRAAELAIEHFADLSLRDLAKMAGVHHQTIANIKAEVSKLDTPDEDEPPAKVSESDSKPPKQLDLFDQLNEDLQPLAAADDDVYSAPYWIDDEIPAADRIKAAQQVATLYADKAKRFQALAASIQQGGSAQ